MSTSASPLAALSSVSWSATRLTAATGSPTSIWVIPPGDTSAGVSEVTAPTTPTVTPLTSNVAYPGSAGVCVPLLYTLAPRYDHLALVPGDCVPASRGHGSVAWPAGPSITRVVRSAKPLSNSWLPTEEALRHISFITSIVGWSCCTAELNSEAPIRSPAPSRSSVLVDDALVLDRRRPPRRQVVRRIDAPVEVVDVQQRDVDRCGVDDAGGRPLPQRRRNVTGYARAGFTGVSPGRVEAVRPRVAAGARR